MLDGLLGVPAGNYPQPLVPHGFVWGKLVKADG
jgi:hypothetical protein